MTFLCDNTIFFCITLADLESASGYMLKLVRVLLIIYNVTNHMYVSTGTRGPEDR